MNKQIKKLLSDRHARTRVYINSEKLFKKSLALKYLELMVCYNLLIIN